MAQFKCKLSTKVDKTTHKSEIQIRFTGPRGFDKRIKSNLFILPEKWDSEKGMVKTFRSKTAANEEAKQIQIKLNMLQNALASEFETCFKSNPQQIDDNWYDNVVDRFHYPEKYIAKKSIYDTTLMMYIEDFITNIAPYKKHKKTLAPLAPNMLQQYKATQKKLLQYFQTTTRNDLFFKEIDEQFYNSFVAYLQSEKFYINTIGKHIRVLKTMLNNAPKDLQSLSKHKDFYVFDEDNQNIYLTEEELTKLWDCDLSSQPHLEKVRDWFVILAWTGCRYSDLPKVIKVNKKATNISYKQQKTGTNVVIAIHHMVRSVLEKYDYKIPSPISNQKFNEEIKIAAELAGLNEEIEIEKNIGGVITQFTYKKYEVICSHTGRRSFCTNAYKQKVPTYNIMKASGHKTERSFLKYIKMSEEEHAEQMAIVWDNLYNKEKTNSSISEQELKDENEKLKEKIKTIKMVNSALIRVNAEQKNQIDELRSQLYERL